MTTLSIDARHAMMILITRVRELTNEAQRRIPANQNLGQSDIDAVKNYAETKEALGYLTALVEISTFIWKMMEHKDD